MLLHFSEKSALLMIVSLFTSNLLLVKDNTSITEKKEELESSHLDHTIAGSEIPPNTIESKARERPTGALATFGRNLLIKNLQRKATTELDHVNTESSGLERKDSKEINTTPSPSISLRTPQGNKVPLPGINPITGNSQVNKDKELPKPPQAQPKKKGGLGLFLFGDIFNKTPVIQEDKTEQIESARLRKKSNDNIKKKSEFNKNMNDSSIIDSQPILTNEGMTTPSAAGGDTSRHLTTKRVDKSVVLTPEEIQRQETILQVVVDNFFGPNENPILGNEEVLAEHPSILFEADRFGDDD